MLPSLPPRPLPEAPMEVGEDEEPDELMPELPDEPMPELPIPELPDEPMPELPGEAEPVDEAPPVRAEPERLELLPLPDRSEDEVEDPGVLLPVRDEEADGEVEAVDDEEGEVDMWFSWWVPLAKGPWQGGACV